MQISNEGTVWLFTPETDEEREWLDENVELEEWQWLGTSFAVDHRPARHLAEGLVEAGFEINGRRHEPRTRQKGGDARLN